MELTVKEYAAAERVNERTVRRWIAKGAVPIRRTPGGGLRIAHVLLGPFAVFSAGPRQPPRGQIRTSQDKP